MKQLLLSVLWTSIGFCGLAFSLHDWNISLRQSDDWLYGIQPGARIAALFFGLAFVCIGIIPLVTTRRPAAVLLDTQRVFRLMLWIGLAVAAYATVSILRHEVPAAALPKALPAVLAGLIVATAGIIGVLMGKQRRLR